MCTCGRSNDQVGMGLRDDKAVHVVSDTSLS